MKRRAWVIYQLSLKRQSLASLSRKYGHDRTAAGKALSAPYPAWEKRIAHALDIEPQQLFPERYDADGQPNRTGGRPPAETILLMKMEDSTTGDRRNTQNREAA